MVRYSEQLDISDNMHAIYNIAYVVDQFLLKHSTK